MIEKWKTRSQREQEKKLPFSLWDFILWWAMVLSGACAALLLLTRCAAMPGLALVAIQEAPSIIQTVENLVAASKNKPATIEQVQTGLNALQTIPVVANSVPTAQAVQTALLLAGTPQLAPALTLPYQRAVLEAAGAPEPHAVVSTAIVTAQSAPSLK